jgi:carbamoyl-phosphate synthase large subunit
VQLIADGDVALVVNTPHGSAGSGGSVRVDGYEIRTAAVRANVPCITTVQGLGAAVQGIEARIRGDIRVRSLQDWAARSVETVAVQPPQEPPFETVAAQPPQEP